MSWRDRLLTASYRGARFKIENSTTSVGRRNVVHQFIDRKEAYVQDLGKDNDTFTITGYVIQSTANGFDYINERDNLINSLKREGSGLLIHPYYGFKKVSVIGKANIKEDMTRGGMATFTINFTESVERVLPVKLTNFLDAIDNAINNIYDTVGDFFYIAYTASGAFMNTTNNIINKSSSLVLDTLTGIQAIPTKFKAQAISNVNIILSTGIELINSSIDIFNLLKDSADITALTIGLAPKIKKEQENTDGYIEGNEKNVKDRASDTYTTKLTFPDSVIGGNIGDYSGVARGEITELNGETVPRDIGKSLLRSISDQLSNFNTDDFKVLPNEQVNNVVVILNTIKLCILANACRIGLRINFFNESEIIEYRQLIMDRMYEILLDLGALAADGAGAIGIGTSTEQIDTKDIYISLQELINVFSDGMLSKISDIAKTIDYNTPPGQSNCLSLAYDKYEDLDRMTEIFLENNNITNPGFIPGGSVIRILDE